MKYEEIWKDVIGYEGCYEVSNLGRVRTVGRTIMRSNGSPQYIHGKIKDQSEKSDGYMIVNLHKQGRGMKSARVNRLVAEAFLKDWDENLLVDHKDRDKANNNLNNLRMATKSTNSANSKKQSNGNNKYKGVRYDPIYDIWNTEIMYKGLVQNYYFKTEIDAARMYDILAEKLFGEFASTNVSLGLLPEPDDKWKLYEELNRKISLGTKEKTLDYKGVCVSHTGEIDFSFMFNRKKFRYKVPSPEYGAYMYDCFIRATKVKRKTNEERGLLNPEDIQIDIRKEIENKVSKIMEDRYEKAG